MGKVGLGKIRKVVKKLNIKMNHPTITINSTSLGKVDKNIVKNIYTSFVQQSSLIQPGKLKLIYPTLKYIEE